MDGKSAEQPEKQGEEKLLLANKARDRQEVISVRTWKDYLGEFLLIVFSVLFALLLTETFNNIHQRQHTKEVINASRLELIDNKKGAMEQYQYHLQVLKNIDSALYNPALASKFINKGVINLDIIAPHGVLYRDLNNVAWEVAKQENIISKVKFSEYSLLTSIYDNQARITKAEEQIASVLLSRESRTAEDNRITLILVHDNYHGWAVDRVPGLLENYAKAIDALEKY